MIRLEKAGREDLATLVQLQEMVRARLLPEGQPLPKQPGTRWRIFLPTVWYCGP